jgi:hypothetical protein
MKAIRVIVAPLLVTTIFALIVFQNHSQRPLANPAPQQTISEQPSTPADSTPVVSEIKIPIGQAPVGHIVSAPQSENIPPSTNKLERLNQIRQIFHTLAAGAG